MTTDAASTVQKPRTPRARLLALWTAAGLLVAVLAFLVWASQPSTAVAAPLDAVKSDPAISVVETVDAVVLTPRESASSASNLVETPTRGLVFIAGARVEPAAYASQLAGLADAGVTVVIARPILNFAILDWRPLSTFTDLAPSVQRWAVGGHSLGGVRACQYASDTEVDSLILFGSYCSVDISASDLPVLSLGGSRDGLSTPAKIADAAHLLPSSALFWQIDGGNHASFGNYGAQPGDNTATISRADAREQITADVLRFLAES
jgi:pimeloyl-ACP methyl ester carboxylesterase